MTLVDCIAMNSPTGYRSETDSNLIMINCKALGVTDEKNGAGTMTIINANAISPT